jgi:pimeloyl-ACP methyl ester carboxylesterase
MATALDTRIEDRFVTVDGLNIRYIEQGEGAAVILLHGASLGSSADVFLGNLGPLAEGGRRVIAYDQPGFGLSDNPDDYGVPYRRDFILKFMDALGLETAALVGHSQAGAMALGVALGNPERLSHVIVAAGGSALPPLPPLPKDAGDAGDAKAATATAAPAAPVEGREGAPSEPTIEDTRKLLEANLYHVDLITEDALALRHSRSLGKNFEAFLARGNLPSKGGGGATPVWQRLGEIKVPLMLIYGREDRADAAARAELLKQQQPGLNIHIVEGCKHMLPWDAAAEFHRLAKDFLAG